MATLRSSSAVGVCAASRFTLKPSIHLWNKSNLFLVLRCGFSLPSSAAEIGGGRDRLVHSQALLDQLEEQRRHKQQALVSSSSLLSSKDVTVLSERPGPSLIREAKRQERLNHIWAKQKRLEQSAKEPKHRLIRRLGELAKIEHTVNFDSNRSLHRLKKEIEDELMIHLKSFSLDDCAKSLRYIARILHQRSLMTHSPYSIKLLECMDLILKYLTNDDENCGNLLVSYLSDGVLSANQVRKTAVTLETLEDLLFAISRTVEVSKSTSLLNKDMQNRRQFVIDNVVEYIVDRNREGILMHGQIDCYSRMFRMISELGRHSPSVCSEMINSRITNEMIVDSFIHLMFRHGLYLRMTHVCLGELACSLTDRHSSGNTWSKNNNRNSHSLCDLSTTPLLVPIQKMLQCISDVALNNRIILLNSQSDNYVNDNKQEGRHHQRSELDRRMKVMRALIAQFEFETSQRVSKEKSAPLRSGVTVDRVMNAHELKHYLIGLTTPLLNHDSFVPVFLAQLLTDSDHRGDDHFSTVVRLLNRYESMTRSVIPMIAAFGTLYTYNGLTHTFTTQMPVSLPRSTLQKYPSLRQFDVTAQSNDNRTESDMVIIQGGFHVVLDECCRRICKDISDYLHRARMSEIKKQNIQEWTDLVMALGKAGLNDRVLFEKIGSMITRKMKKINRKGRNYQSNGGVSLEEFKSLAYRDNLLRNNHSETRKRHPFCLKPKFARDILYSHAVCSIPLSDRLFTECIHSLINVRFNGKYEAHLTSELIPSLYCVALLRGFDHPDCRLLLEHSIGRITDWFNELEHTKEEEKESSLKKKNDDYRHYYSKESLIAMNQVLMFHLGLKTHQIEQRNIIGDRNVRMNGMIITMLTQLDERVLRRMSEIVFRRNSMVNQSSPSRAEKYVNKQLREKWTKDIVWSESIYGISPNVWFQAAMDGGDQPMWYPLEIDLVVYTRQMLNDHNHRDCQSSLSSVRHQIIDNVFGDQIDCPIEFDYYANQLSDNMDYSSDNKRKHHNKSEEGSFSKLNLNRKAIAVNVEGEHHYLRIERELNGKTQFRNWVLSVHGLDVISVPVRDFVEPERKRGKVIGKSDYKALAEKVVESMDSKLSFL